MVSIFNGGEVMILLTIFSILGIISGVSIFFLMGQFNWYNYLILLLLVGGSILIIIAIYALLLLILSLLVSNKNDVKKIPKFYSFIVRETASLLLILMNVRVTVIGKEKLPTKHALYVSNHISGFDAMVVMRYVKSRPLAVVTKIEFLNRPITGHLFHQAGFIHINRSDDYQAAKALVKGIEYMRHDEASVYICPEGTRNHNLDDLLPYHAGSFKMAYKAKKPIVVLAIKNTNIIKKNHILKPTHVIFEVVRVYEYDEYKNINTNDLAEQIRVETLKALKELK